MKGQQLNASIIAQTRLTSADEFGKILLKVNQDGSRVRLRDVAKVELGERTTTSLRSSTVNRHPVWVSSWQQVLTPRHRKRYPRRTEEDGTVLPVRSEDRLPV